MRLPVEGIGYPEDDHDGKGPYRWSSASAAAYKIYAAEEQASSSPPVSAAAPSPQKSLSAYRLLAGRLRRNLEEALIAVDFIDEPFKTLLKSWLKGLHQELDQVEQYLSAPQLAILPAVLESKWTLISRKINTEGETFKTRITSSDLAEDKKLIFAESYSRLQASCVASDSLTLDDLRAEAKHIAFLKCLSSLAEVEGASASCFISYAWGHRPSEERVHQLAVDLKLAGISPVLDVFDNRAGSIARFKERIARENFVLLIGSTLLKSKWEAPEGHVLPGELELIDARMREKGTAHEVILWLLEGEAKTSFPDFINYLPYLDCRLKVGYPQQFFKLLSLLTEGQAAKQSQLVRIEADWNRQMELIASSDEVSLQRFINTQEEEAKTLERDQAILHRSLESRRATLERQMAATATLLGSTNAVELERPFGQIPAGSSSFVERLVLQKAILHHLTQQASTAQTQICAIVPTTTLKGLGGVGKTQLAAFMLQQAKAYSLRAWFDASSIDRLKLNYRDLGAIQLKLFGLELKIDDAAKLVKDYLETHPGWLLVYDNANSYEELHPLLPQRGGHILVTSRTRHWPEASWIEVDVMKPEEAQTLLRNIIGSREEDTTLDQLARTLGYLPLALAQAAHYIKTTRKSIAEYLALYEKYEKELLEKNTFPVGERDYYLDKEGNRIAKTVGVTWQISIDQIKESTPEALSLLQAVAYLGNNSLPEQALQAVMHNTYGEKAELLYGEARSALLDYSLFKEDPTTAALSIHQLVQTVTRVNMSSDEQKLMMESLARIFTDHLDSARKKILIGEQTKLLVHFEKLLDFIMRLAANGEACFAKALRVAADIQNLISSHESSQKSINYAEKAKKIYESLEDKGALAATLNALSTAYFNRGSKKDLELAVKFCEEALKIQEDASWLNNLGNIYHQLGGQENLTKAKDCLEESIIQKKKRGAKGLPLAISYNILANICMDLDRDDKDRKEALLNYECAYCIFSDADLNSDGKAALEKANHLSCYSAALTDIGGKRNLEKAVRLLKDALKIYEDLKIEEHRQLATCHNNLGHVYRELKKYEEAMIEQNKALRIRKKLLGDSHPDTALSYYNIASIYADQADEIKVKKDKRKKLVLAIENYKLALVIRVKTHGAESVETITTLNDLAVAHKDLQEANDYALEFDKDEIKSYFMEWAEKELNVVLTKYKLATEELLPTHEKALRRAASQADVEAATLLLAKVSDINAPDENPRSRKTALHWAVITNSEAIVKLLLAAGARTDTKDAAGKTAADYAQELKLTEIYSLLARPQTVRPSTTGLFANSGGAAASAELPAQELYEQKLSP